jgi:hypothetical protein
MPSHHPKEGPGVARRRAGLLSSIGVEVSSERREFYRASNGDSWHLCRDANHVAVVVHEPNEASGGQSSVIELSTFLRPGNQGPEHQALRALIGTLVYP